MRKVFWCKKMKFYRLNSPWVAYKLYIEVLGKAFRLPYWVSYKSHPLTAKRY